MEQKIHFRYGLLKIPLWLTEGIEIKMAEDIESNDHVNFYDISINYRINSKISLHEK